MDRFSFGEKFTGEITQKNKLSNSPINTKETKTKPIDNSIGRFSFGEKFTGEITQKNKPQPVNNSKGRFSFGEKFDPTYGTGPNVNVVGNEKLITDDRAPTDEVTFEADNLARQELSADVVEKVNSMYDTEFKATKAKEYDASGKSTRTGVRRKAEFADIRRGIEQDLRRQGVVPEQMEQAMEDELKARGIEVGSLSETAEVYAEQESARAVEKVNEKKERLIELLTSENFVTSGLTDQLLNSGLSISQINTIVTADEFLNPVTGIVDVPILFKDAGESIKNGDYGVASLQVGAAALSLAPAFGVVKVGTKVAGKSRKKVMDKIVAADTSSTKETVEAARVSANTGEGKEIGQQFLREFEEANEVNVTDVDPETGKLSINQQKARDAGRDTATDVMNLQASRSASEADLIAQGKDADRIFTDAEAFLDVGEDADALMSPILKAEKFNAIVSIAKDFKINNPNSWSNDKTVIDNLFELTVGKDIDANQELADSLAKYGLTFDEYVMTVVSGGSDAGKILNKLSQIKRAGHLDNVNATKNKALEKRQKGFMRTFRRLENIRRGGMVSMIKTAARNLQSAAIRAPMEAFENIMDNTIYALQNDGVIAGGKALLDLRGGWKGSLSHLKYMYRNPVLAKELTEHILDRPEFAKQYTNLFDNVNEYQKVTGRGEGGALDTVLSKVEDVVTFANTPNRIQEYLVRRGAFMGEMERLVQREYGIDFLEALKDGKLRDLMANSSSVRPKGKAKFEDLIEQSIRRALDVTYAKAPDVPMFKSASDFITRNGLTTVIEFPRFMFNSLELMGQYSAGAANPVLKRIMGKRGPLDAKDRQNITRNMTGAMAIYAAYQYRTSGQEPASYEQVNTGDGTVMDVTPQFPLRQTLWIGEAINQVMKGTLNNWKGFTADEMLETFGGASMRTGASNVFIDEIGDMISNAGDLKGEEQAGKLLGATMGNYLASWGVPLAQVIEAQRISGNRPMTYEDRSGDYILKDFGESFTSNVERSFDQRYGNIFNPSAIGDMPLREGLFDVDSGRTRVGAIGSGLFGITRFTGNSENAEYLIRKGFNDWELGSQEPVKKVRNAQNKLMRKNLNQVVGAVKNIEVGLRKKYMEMSPEYKSGESIDAFVNKQIRPIIKGFTNDIKKLTKEAAKEGVSFNELATDEYNKIPKDRRIRAKQAYDIGQDKLNEKDRTPFDRTNGAHLLILKALDEALSTGDTIF
ncbi:MAG: hypothetical protein CBC83_04745 [Flavobacteriales bacterium TMED123]|nr:hypothetical protein [Candidatus Neomarinimicrobiota bacterium]OUV73949.1 MAG: hypothetical protein CBC83_04745 [Flavobacteriales bacterium TMED123]